MRNDIVIVGLCGRAGSGKTSVANHLVRDRGFKRLSFAEPLKRMAMDIWGFSHEQVFGDATVKETIDPRWDITPREAMQKLGQAARDHLSETIWIESALNRIEAPGFYVIEDVRYRNEAAALHGIGHVFRLHCSDSVSTDAGDHPSEKEVDLIPSYHVAAEIYSSREKGLFHLYAEFMHHLAQVTRMEALGYDPKPSSAR